MDISSKHGRITLSRFTDTHNVGAISSRTLPISSVCFSVEIAEQIAVIISGIPGIQISMCPLTNLFYIIVHESESTGWVASLDSIVFTNSLPAQEVIQQERHCYA